MIETMLKGTHACDYIAASTLEVKIEAQKS